MSIISMFISSCSSVNDSDVQTAKNVDLKRYMGKWYEVARYDNNFEKCVIRAYAIYTLNPDSSVKVENYGERENGVKRSVEGIAYSTNRDNSKLRVSFFWPFYGDYYILELDENYQWALIGSRDKSYFWILARTPKLDSQTFEKVMHLMEFRGYDKTKLIWNKQLYLSDLNSAGNPNN